MTTDTRAVIQHGELGRVVRSRRSDRDFRRTLRRRDERNEPLEGAEAESVVERERLVAREDLRSDERHVPLARVREEDAASRTSAAPSPSPRESVVTMSERSSATCGVRAWNPKRSR